MRTAFGASESLWPVGGVYERLGIERVGDEFGGRDWQFLGVWMSF